MYATFKAEATTTQVTPSAPRSNEDIDAEQRPTVLLLPRAGVRIVELPEAAEVEDEPPPESAPYSRHRARSPREPSSTRTPVPVAAERVPAPAPDRSLRVLVIVAGFGVVNAAVWVVVLLIGGGAAPATTSSEPRSGASMQVVPMASQAPPSAPQSSEPGPDGGDAGNAPPVPKAERSRPVVSPPRVFAAPARPARASGSEVIDPWRQ